MKVHMGVRAGAFAADFHVYLFSVGGAACRTAIFQSDLRQGYGDNGAVRMAGANGQLLLFFHQIG